MQFVRGNLAVRGHAEAGKDLHLFEKVEPAHLRYVGQRICAGYDLVPDTPDRNGDPRTAIVFRLVALDGDAPFEADSELEPPTPGEPDLPASWYWDRPLHELRSLATQPVPSNTPAEEVRRTVYRRSAAVRIYVLRRAEGQCEGCGVPAPFVTAAGRPYLEPHHTRRLSDGGPDDPAFVIAVCPTCHRRAHYASDSTTFNRELEERVSALEAAIAT